MTLYPGTGDYRILFLNDYLDQNDGKVDFIHGDEVVNELGVKEGNMGFFFPPISKRSLFKTIIFDGALPRKTFSMGAGSR